MHIQVQLTPIIFATDPPDPNKETPEDIRMNDKAYCRHSGQLGIFLQGLSPPALQHARSEKRRSQREYQERDLWWYFEWYCTEGLKIAWSDLDENNAHNDYRERLDSEMDIIEYMGFPAYMLIVAELSTGPRTMRSRGARSWFCCWLVGRIRNGHYRHRSSEIWTSL